MDLNTKPIKKGGFFYISKVYQGIHPPAYRPPTQRKSGYVSKKIHQEIFDELSIEDDMPDFLMD